MQYPKNLQEGGIIAFAAPSFGCTIEPYRTSFTNALNTFQDMGYSAALGPNCYEDSGFMLSNKPELTGGELTDLYCDPRFSAIISCGGGEMMCRTIEHIDWSRIRDAKPKWFMGYSDNTHFSFLLNTLCDTAAVYGPNAPAFGQREWHPAVKDALELLKGKREFTNYPLWEKTGLKDEEHPLESYNCTEKYKHSLYDADHKPVGSLKLQGRLIGGCLDVLANLCGTTFDRVPEFNAKYKDDGIIWFLECCDYSPLDLIRSVWRMKYCGWMKNVKGVILGRPYNIDADQPSWEEATLEAFKDFGIPIIKDIDLGHLPPAIPFISGSVAELEAEATDSLKIKYIER